MRALGGRCFEWRELDDFLALVARIEALLNERDFILRAQWGFMLRDVFAAAGSWLDNDGGDHTVAPNFPFKRIEEIAVDAGSCRRAMEEWMEKFSCRTTAEKATQEAVEDRK